VTHSSAGFDFDGAIYAQGVRDGAAAERERWTRIEPDPGQPGYNRGVFDASGFVAEVYATQIAEAVAAERERVTRVLLGCQVCGKIHESRKAGGLRTAADPDDGHPYRPPVSTDRPAERRRIADLIAGDGQ